MSFSGLARLGSGSRSSGSRRLYARVRTGNLLSAWHSALVGPRDPLDSLVAECGARLEMPVVLESYPFGSLCVACGARRMLGGIGGPA
jgi:hypothetical protein